MAGTVTFSFIADLEKARADRDVFISESQKPIPLTFSGGPSSATPPNALAPGAPPSGLTELNRPIPIQLDFSAARTQLASFVNEMAAAMRSATAGVGGQPTAAERAGIIQGPSGAGSAFVVPSQVLGQSVNGGQIVSNAGSLVATALTAPVAIAPVAPPRPVADVTSEDRAAEQAFRNQRAILEGPAWAAAHREEFGRLPSRRDVVGRFGADTDVAQAVADDARDVHGRGRQQERRAAAEARRVKQEEAIAERDARDAERVQQQEAQEQAAPGGGNGRIFGLRAGRIGQIATAGIVLMEGLRIGQAYRDYHNQLGLAEGAEDQYKAETGLADRLASVPIVGQIADLATSGSRFGNEQLIASSARQDNYTDLIRQSGAAALDLRNRADISSAAPFARPALAIRQRFEAENRAIADRSAIRAQAQEKDNQARLAGIDEQYPDISVDDFLEVTSEGRDNRAIAREAAIERHNAVVRDRTLANNRQTREEREDAQRQQYGELRDNRESRRNQAESYDIQRLQYRADAQPFRDRVTDRQLERNADDLKEAEMRIDPSRGPGVANQFRRANQEKYKAEDVEYERGTRTAQIGLYGGARSALLRGGGDPFAAQQNDILTQGQVAVANLQHSNPALIIPTIANNLAELGANFQTMFRQFSVAQGQTQFQSQSIEAAIAHDPLQARILGLRGERLGALDEADRSTPAGPLREARETSVNRLYDDRERYEKQRFGEEIERQRFALNARSEELDMIVNGPDVNPGVREARARSMHVLHSIEERAKAAMQGGQGVLLPEIQREGLLELQGQRAEFLRGFQPKTLRSLEQADTSGPGSADTATIMKEIKDEQKKLTDYVESLKTSAANSSSKWDDLLAVLRRLIPQ